LGRQDRVREPQWLLLENVGDAQAKARAVAHRAFDLRTGLRRNDDADVLDPGFGHRLEPVEEDRLVGDRHELLCARMRDRAQARSLASRQDQSLQRLHARAAYSARQFRGPHRDWKLKRPMKVFELGAPGPMRDRLVAAVLSGRKTASSSLLADWQREGEPLAVAGQQRVVVDSAE